MFDFETEHSMLTRETANRRLQCKNRKIEPQNKKKSRKTGEKVPTMPSVKRSLYLTHDFPFLQTHIEIEENLRIQFGQNGNI